MKKITLFALAALTASSAFAAFPQLNAVKSQRIQNKLQESAAVSVVKATESKSISRAEDGVAEEIIPELPTYMTFDALYMGLSPTLAQYSKPFGFVPSTGSANFTPFYKADSYSWSWLKFLKGGVVEEQSSSETALSIPVNPFDQFEGPTLKMGAGNMVITYCDSVLEYFAGGFPALYFNEDPEDRVGLTPVKFTSDLTRTLEASINYTGTPAGYDKATGTYNDFIDIIYSDYSRFDEVDSVYVTDYTDFKINGYGTVVPGSSAPYLLSSGFFVVAAETKEVAEVKIAVLGIDKDGYINFTDTIGTGSMLLPKGKTAGAVNFTLSAVDEILGLPTDQPIVVPTQGVYLSFYGVNDPENITLFSPYYNTSNKIDYLDRTESGTLNPIYNYTNPRHAFIEFTCKNPEGEVVSDYCPNFGFYGNDINALSRAFEYLIFYNVEFPYLACATEGYGSGDMTVEVPAEGGYVNRWFEANQDIVQLIDDEYVTVEEAGDTEWYVFDTEPDEEYPFAFNLQIEAEPLPAGVEGRKATITFSGYGFDNTITIIQGTPASINDVVAAQAKNGKVYDLQGRVVTKATKGIYIVDGKKVIL